MTARIISSLWFMVHGQNNQPTNQSRWTFSQRDPDLSASGLTNDSKKGFTLIELLIAISIIAIVSAIGFVSYSQAQVTARDAKRKQDLNSIRTALQLYYQANKHYPCTLTGVGWLSSNLPPWITDSVDSTTQDTTCASTAASTVAFDQNYINQVPVDPLANTGLGYIAGKNGYSYWGGDLRYLAGWGTICPAKGQYYLLVTQLENQDDPNSLWSIEGATGGKKILCNGNIDPSAGGTSYTNNSYSKNSYIIAPDL